MVFIAGVISGRINRADNVVIKYSVIDSSLIREFSANFAKSAALLNADNNFIPNQINNLGRVIHYIDEHKAALAQEFGSGDPATPSGKIAQALAAYNQS